MADHAYKNRKKLQTVDDILIPKERSSIPLYSFVTETCIGFQFWCLFQGLGPMIWFYPLNELDITGYEAIVLVLLSPIIVAIPHVLPLIQSRPILGLLRLTAVASLASFQAPSTLSRLVILAVGIASHMLALTASLWSCNFKYRFLTFWGLILGLFLFICSRIWFLSFVPTWWSPRANSIVIAIATVATLSKILTDNEVSEDDSFDERTQTAVNYHIQPRNYTQIIAANPLQQKTMNSFSSFATGVGFGSLLYATHACFGEVSVICRWVVRGYPYHSPEPTMWGALVLVCIYVGMSISWLSLGLSRLWWIVGCAGFASLYYLPSWYGFTGGLILSLYLMSIWPDVVDRVTHCPPARCLVIAIITYLVEIFFSVWTVAYNFVPGGVYTRERTDILIAFVMLTIGFCLFIAKRKQACSFTDFRQSLVQNSSFAINTLFIVIFLFGFGGFIHRYSSTVPPVQKENKQFTAAIWTYHFGYDNKGWPSLERSAQFLNNTNADVITLLESDASKPFLGNNDLGMWLGARLGMFVDFGPSTKDHTWGNLILSKHPIIQSRHHLLPSPYGELAPAITATVNISGNPVDFVVTHMGNDRDNLDRKLQAEFLANELSNSLHPVVFLGYVTSAPFSRDYKTLTTSGRVKDIDPTDNDRWCEYIMYRGLVRQGYARVSHGGLSDTELQMATFSIPKHPTNFLDNERTEINPSVVDKSYHFSNAFGSYHRGHGYFDSLRFHMGTPKYFVP